MALLEYPTMKYLPGAVANMLRRWNFKEGSGLGARGHGIVAPVQAAVARNRPRAGLGYQGSRRRGRGRRRRRPRPKKAYENGLPDPYTTRTPPVVEEKQCFDENKCYDKTIALLGLMRREEEAAAALAAVVKSKKWKASLPPSTVHYIVEQVIKPKMAVGVLEWIPTWECEDWIRPWMPLIGHLPETLYDAVERKLIPYATNYAVVSPWKVYMNPTQWDTFSGRHIRPWLARLVRELMITPPQQVDSSLQTVMLWTPLIPAQDVVSILETEMFFERWEETLVHWMQSGAKPSLNEALAWCIGWKKLFTPELLRDERVRKRLGSGFRRLAQA